MLPNTANSAVFVIFSSHYCLGTEVPRLSAGSSDGGTYIRARKRADYLNSAHHKRPKQARLHSGMAQVRGGWNRLRELSAKLPSP